MGPCLKEWHSNGEKEVHTCLKPNNSKEFVKIYGKSMVKEFGIKERSQWGRPFREGLKKKPDCI